MKRSLDNWRVLGMGLCLLFVVTGCETVHECSLTYRLWDEDLRKWSEPSPTPHLALFETPGHTNLLVEYDSYSEKHERINRQAYYLLSNQRPIRAGKAPRFVAPGAANGMNPIPVYEASAFTNTPPTHLTNYAIISTSGREFTMHPQAELMEHFQLPVYPERTGTFTHVALTPVAVVGDTATVGLVAGVVALYGEKPDARARPAQRTYDDNEQDKDRQTWQDLQKIKKSSSPEAPCFTENWSCPLARPVHYVRRAGSEPGNRKD